MAVIAVASAQFLPPGAQFLQSPGVPLLQQPRVQLLQTPRGQIVQAPGTRGTVRGPDGSIVFVPPSFAPPPGALLGTQVPNPGGFRGPPPFSAYAYAPRFAPQSLLQGAGLPVAPPSLLQGSGVEGQYIPDNLEQLYDDGSYKPWLYGL